MSDNYGQVLVDKLEPGKDYVVTVAHDGYEAVAVPVRLEASRTLETIVLKKAYAPAGGAAPARTSVEGGRPAQRDGPFFVPDSRAIPFCGYNVP